MRALAPALVLALCWPAAASLAATRAFAETVETRTGSEGDAQIETWVDADNAFSNWNVWRFWWGGTASITDALEVSVYAVGAQQRAGSAYTGEVSTGLELEGIFFAARYRFLGTGGEGFSLMGQLDYTLPTLPTLPDQSEAGYNYLEHSNVIGERLIASYQYGRLLASANLDLAERFELGQQGAGYTPSLALTYAAGVACSVLKPGPRGPPFTLGVEAFGDFPFAHLAETWSQFWPGGFPVAVGPAASFASGRFWVTASWGYAPGGAWESPKNWSSTEGVGRLIAAFEF